MYGNLFYKTRRSWTRKAAAAAMPEILKLIQPTSLVDVGCGTGIWLAEAKRQGVPEVLGLDGPWVPRDLLEVPSESFVPWNLTEALPVRRTFAMAMSLEVGEHLGSEHAAAFVESLTKLSPVVVYSAAIPGQGGENHVNEQWPSYWIALFAARGYRAFDVVRPALWKDERVPYWYRQNIIVFASSQAPAAVLERLAEAERKGTFAGADLVHPDHAMRALQYPGLGALVRAFPFALVRSLSWLLTALKSPFAGKTQVEPEEAEAIAESGKEESPLRRAS